MNEKEEYGTLIKSCIDWERSGQEKLYRIFAKDLLKVCYIYVKDKDEAADMLHDVFLHIFKNIQKYQGPGNLGAWLRKITVNFCLQNLRSNKKISFSTLDENLNTSILDENEEEEKYNFTFSKVLDEINLLPEKAALVLKLYALEGWSHAEIAEELEISVGTSKSQLNYARTILKSKLK
jgi:RNA polymerase sigma factor (sigma-70 family)